MSAEEPIGFIGLGIMGRGMAANLARAGRALHVWNRTTATADGFAAAYPGAVTVASTAGEVVSRCKVVYSMLSNLEASAAVFGEVLASVSSANIIVDCATLTPERMQGMQRAVEQKGGQFLEAPVSGSKKPAADGNLIFMVAGSATAFEAVKEDLEIMGKATHYFGSAMGAASKMKLCVNMIMGAQLAALGEGIALCEAAGLPSSSLVDILGQGAMASVLVDKKGHAIVDRSYDTSFPLVHAQKDVRFALNVGDKLGLSLPVSAAANEQYKRARGLGHGSEDFCAVFEAVRLSESTGHSAGAHVADNEDAPSDPDAPVPVTPISQVDDEPKSVRTAGAPSGVKSVTGNPKNASSLGTGFYDPMPQRSSTRRIAPPGGSSSIIF